MIIVIGIKTQSCLVSCDHHFRVFIGVPEWTGPDTDPAYSRQLRAHSSLVITHAALTPILLLTLLSRPLSGFQLQHGRRRSTPL